ncbi:MAG: HAMP domain-containing histidine kinase, partial [Candidatus Obscuribacterales bacterium]|nr:HAMP domain-containing histidine kinase [Candidatus Obscuribacterales bacterium]
MGSTSINHSVPAGLFADGARERQPQSARVAVASNLKIVGIEEARAKKLGRTVSRACSYNIESKSKWDGRSKFSYLDLNRPAVCSPSQPKEEENYPYVVARWVEHTIACLIRPINKNAPVVCVIYPGDCEKRKRRYFSYEFNNLVRVETYSGQDDASVVIYERDAVTGSWFLISDGIKARMPGQVSVSREGTLHVQTDGRGLCREEHPDGSVTRTDNCCSGTKNDLGMLSMVGHDLRSPLMSVQGLLTLLSSGALGELSDKAKSRIHGVESDLTRLIRLINDLLEAEMLSRGKRGMQFEQVCVQELFDAVTWALSGLAEMKQVELASTDSSLDLDADIDSLIRVLVNITANAIKYSQKNSLVYLSAELEGDEV